MAAPEHREKLERRRDRRLVAISVGGTIFFVLTMVIASTLYPGGTWLDRSAEGHSFLGNYFCDLMQHRAMNGQSSELGSLFARVGSVAMFAALGSFVVQVANMEQPPTLRARITRRAGLTGAILACSVPLLTSDHFRTAHVIAVVGSFLPALASTIAAFGICLRSPRSTALIKATALLTLVIGGIDGLLYAFVYGLYGLGFHLPADVNRLINHLLPAFQRMASLFLLAWVLAVSLSTARR